MQRSRINKEPFIHPFPLGGCSSHLLCSLSRHFGRKLLCSEHCDLDCHWSHTSRCSEPISSSCLQGKGTVRGQTSPPLLLRSHPPPRVPRASFPGRRPVFWVVLALCRSQRPFTRSRGPGPPPSPSRRLAWRGCGKWPCPPPRLAFISKALAFGIV